ncbi:hypothetical protein QFC22_006060 [Naganishia vaughanmartiniae]|uniref:Uncharacterized protein n=1 Tax=Naganishia vaughanmartiniae TaxID=1424756 RepID=A0ACC2WQ47_9TREE|nr:hypothetical protein QFC22_006060 [Naganishia vaughanmartiniae]
MSRTTQAELPRSRPVEPVTKQDAPACRTRSRTTTTTDKRGIDSRTPESGMVTTSVSAENATVKRLRGRTVPGRPTSFSMPTTGSSSLSALYVPSLPAMPRTPPPAPSKDSIRDFAGYFATLSTPRKSHGQGETDPTSAHHLNQNAVSSSSARTESTDNGYSVDTVSPSIPTGSGSACRHDHHQRGRRHSSLSSTTSATLSVSTTTDQTTTTTAEEESRVERELLVPPPRVTLAVATAAASAEPVGRAGLRVRLRVRQPSEEEQGNSLSRSSSNTAAAAKRRRRAIHRHTPEEADDDDEYFDEFRTRKKKRTGSAGKEGLLGGERETRGRELSATASRESTASLGSAAPKSSHGRNTRSSTLAADPAQTLESVGAANKALDDRLREIGLRVVNVASDGNCLFRVFAHQLFDDAGRHLELRRAICDYLKTHAETLSCYNWNEHGESYEQYVTRMRKPKVWGGYLELYAFTQLYACRLIIYESDREQVFGGEGGDVPDNARVVRLSYHGGVHYNSVVPAEQDGEDDVASSVGTEGE